MKQLNLLICILGLCDVGFAQVEKGGNIDWLLFPAKKTAEQSNMASSLNLTLKIINTPKQQDAATQTDQKKLNIPVAVVARRKKLPAQLDGLDTLPSAASMSRQGNFSNMPVASSTELGNSKVSSCLAGNELLGESFTQIVKGTVAKTVAKTKGAAMSLCAKFGDKNHKP